jgi:hypothetical protein
MGDDTQRDNQSPRVGRAIQYSGAASTCDAPDCKNPGGAFTSERGGRIYEFCSEECRAKFERPPE